MKEMRVLIEKNNELFALANFEEVVEKSTVIHFSEDTIEIPGIVILKREGSASLLSKILNVDLEVIEISDSVFDKMINTLKTVEVENKLIFKTNIKPEKTVILDLENLKKSAVFVKETSTAIFVNNIIFTTDKLEFHGEGMFTSRRVYFLKDLEKIKSLFQIS